MLEYIDRKFEYRMWKKVIKNQKCWNWGGTIEKSGYGRISLNAKNVLVHRVSWVIRNQKEIPEGMVIMHTCDNRRCVNPEHLVLGTIQENMTDMAVKGRSVCNSLINEDIVASMKEDYRSGMNQRQVAKKYGVTHCTVGAILRGKLWGHLHEGENLSRKSRGEIMAASKLTEEKVREVRDLQARGVMQKDIAEKFGVTNGVISEIVRGTSWAHTYKNTFRKFDRSVRGEESPNSILTEEKVKFIRRALEKGTHKGVELAAKFGVNKATVSAVKNRRIWAHVQ